MAWVRKAPSGRYRAEYRDPSSRKRSRSFARKADAQRWLAEQTTSIARGSYVDPSGGKVRFDTWANRWFEGALHLRPSSRARVAQALSHDVMPVFAARPLASITPSDVRAFVLSLSNDGKAPATVRKSYNVLTSIMSAAVTEGLIGRTPCIGVKLPAVRRREMRFLTADELQGLAAEVDARYAALVLLAGYGGLRWGETAGLRRERIRLLERKLDIVETLIEIDGGRLESGPPKTGNRTVTLPRYLVEVLAAHMARFPSETYIFTSPTGASLRRHNFGRRVFAPAVNRTGLSPLRWHDLRHTAAALAIASGAHPKAIQERLGHSSIQVTLDVYGHLFPSLEETLAERLDEVARGAAAAYLPPERRLAQVMHEVLAR